MINDGLFTSETDLWETPQSFFDELHREFGFEIDVCALPENAKVEHYFTPETDGLSQKWQGVCWMNPPYGRKIGEWVKKAFQSAQEGATVVCLLPARTDTKWWHDYCMKGEIRFIRGRLKFGGSKNSAPFPSAVVIFRPKEAAGMVLTLWYYPQEGIFKDMWGRVVKYWNEMFNLDVIAVSRSHKRTVCFDDPIRKDRLIMHYVGGPIIPLIVLEYDLRLKATDEWFSIGLFVEETDPVRQEYIRIASSYREYFGKDQFPWSSKTILEELVERPCVFSGSDECQFHTDLVRAHEEVFFHDGRLREPYIVNNSPRKGADVHNDLVRTHEALFFPDGELRELPF